MTQDELSKALDGSTSLDFELNAKLLDSEVLKKEIRSLSKENSDLKGKLENEVCIFFNFIHLKFNTFIAYQIAHVSKLREEMSLKENKFSEVVRAHKKINQGLHLSIYSMFL